MPQILAAMQARALDSNHRDSQRAAEYLCDRIYGKPNQPLKLGGELQVENLVRRVVNQVQ